MLKPPFDDLTQRFLDSAPVEEETENVTESYLKFIAGKESIMSKKKITAGPWAVRSDDYDLKRAKAGDEDASQIIRSIHGGTN